jgi:hypothetical protein
VNVSQNELNSLRSLAAKIKGAGSQAMRSVGREQGERLEDVMSLAAQMETRLEQVGAERPNAIASPSSVPLTLLNTPANRRYATALRDAWEAGLAVDRERYGESIGTDGCAQVIEMVLADVEQEISGPPGLIRE